MNLYPHYDTVLLLQAYKKWVQRKREGQSVARIHMRLIKKELEKRKVITR